jgi:transposase-like protein
MRWLSEEQAAIDRFTAARWKNGAFCPSCGSKRIYHFSDRRTHKCGDCRKRFSIKVGTIFEDSKVELRSWLMAIWLLTSRSRAIASAALAREIGVSQKTAWFMLQRLRCAAQCRSFNRPLQGQLELPQVNTDEDSTLRQLEAWPRAPGFDGDDEYRSSFDEGSDRLLRRS